MGRREKPIDPAAGPVQDFACALRAAREEAGRPTYRVMAQRAGYSASALAGAAAGEKLPSLPVALAYVTACGGDLEQWERRWHEAHREEAAGAPAPHEETADPPYRGLARFEPGDSGLFFGRDRLSDELTSLVRDHRCAMLFGPSGSGKSSLLRAGLIPRLRGAEDPRLRPATIRMLTPGPRPAVDHAKLFTPAPEAGETWLVVDQFEELFTLCSDEAERARFIALLLTAQDASSRLRVVLGVRADFYGQCLADRQLAALIRKASLPVTPMTRAELREAVVRPAAAEGLIVERSLTARLVDEAADEPGGLPLLSHALLETWRRRRGRTLTLEAYEAAGGVHGAIAQTAEAAYTRLSPQQAELARRILLRSIAPGDGTADTGRPVDAAELESGDPAMTRQVLDTLARARLITLAEGRVDLAHEALITSWPRLRDWIEDGRERLRAHRRLTEAARTWHDLRRDTGALYRGTRLTEAEAAFPAPRARATAPDALAADELTPLERQFLTLSGTTRLRKRRGVAIAALSRLALLVLLAIMTGLAVRPQGDDGERQREEAAARRAAGVAESLRSSDPQRAMRLSVAAWKIAQNTETRAALLGALTQRADDVLAVPLPEVGAQAFLSRDGRTLTAVSERRRVERWDVRTHHRAAGRTLQEVKGAGEIVPGTRGLARSDDGRLMAACGKGLEVWEAATRRKLSASWKHSVDNCRDEALQFSPDGRTVGILDGTGIRRVDIASGREERRIDRPSLKEFVFASDGSAVVGLSDDEEVLLWRLDAVDGAGDSAAGAQPVFRYRVPGGSPYGVRMDAANGKVRYLEAGSSRRTVTVRTLDLGRAMSGNRRTGADTKVALSPDGRLLLTSRTAARTVRFQLRDRRNGAVLTHLPDIHTGNEVSSPAVFGSFAPDGKTLAYGAGAPGNGAESGTGSTTVWDIVEKQPLNTFAPAGTALGSVNGKLAIAVSDRPGETRILDARSGKQLKQLPGNDGGAFRALAFSPDGAHLAVGDAQGGVTLWDTGSEKRLGVLAGTDTGTGAPEAVTALAFSADSRTLAVAGARGALRLWDVPSARPLGSSLTAPGEAVASVAFTPGDTSVLSVGAHTREQRYTLAPDRVVAEVCDRATGSLSEADWATYLPEVPYREVC